MFDMDGKQYIDYQCGFGPIILGPRRAFSRRLQSREAAGEATSFAMTQRREVEAAEKVIDTLGWPDFMRFTNTGTEATMHAIRLARGVTGRDVVLKFEGQYHGMHDYVLFSTAGVPVSGLGSRLHADPTAIELGNPRGDPRLRAHPSLQRPRPGGAAVQRRGPSDRGSDRGADVGQRLRDPPSTRVPRRVCAGSATSTGAVLIFDEVKTGFRVALGRRHRAFRGDPDIGTYAKALGNGFPVAAIAFKDWVADGWRRGGIAQAGTYSGNGIAAAAASATLDLLRTGEPLARVQKIGTRSWRDLEKILADQGRRREGDRRPVDVLDLHRGGRPRRVP